MNLETLNFSEIYNQNNHYCNNYLWVSFAENFVPKIEKIINEELNYSNFKEIFNNLKDFLKVDDIIINNKIYPYLSDVLENAVLHPEKMHQIIYDEMIDLNNLELLEKFDLVIKKDLNNFELDPEKYLEFKDAVHDGFKNLFNEAKNQIIEYLHLNNVDFVDIIDAAQDCIKLFATFNLDSEDLGEKLYEFGSKISQYLSFNTQSRMNKIDIDKMFAIVFSRENSKDTLFCDFDQKKNFNLDISKLDCDICPKFSIMRFEHHPEVVFTTGCHAALVFSPEASKKLFLMLLDHTLTNQLENLKNISPMPVCVEKRFEILFEYLSEQNINNSDEFNKFVSKNSYRDLYNDFDQYFKEYINYSGEQITNNYYLKHFYQDNTEIFHLFNEEEASDYKISNPENLAEVIRSKGYIINLVTSGADDGAGKTWLRAQDELSKIQKKEIFSNI